MVDQWDTVRASHPDKNFDSNDLAAFYDMATNIRSLVFLDDRQAQQFQRAHEMPAADEARLQMGSAQFCWGSEVGALDTKESESEEAIKALRLYKALEASNMTLMSNLYNCPRYRESDPPSVSFLNSWSALEWPAFDALKQSGFDLPGNRQALPDSLRAKMNTKQQPYLQFGRQPSATKTVACPISLSVISRAQI